MIAASTVVRSTWRTTTTPLTRNCLSLITRPSLSLIAVSRPSLYLITVTRPSLLLLITVARPTLSLIAVTRPTLATSSTWRISASISARWTTIIDNFDYCDFSTATATTMSSSITILLPPPPEPPNKLLPPPPLIKRLEMKIKYIFRKTKLSKASENQKWAEKKLFSVANSWLKIDARFPQKKNPLSDLYWIYWTSYSVHPNRLSFQTNWKGHFHHRHHHHLQNFRTNFLLLHRLLCSRKLQSMTHIKRYREWRPVKRKREKKNSWKFLQNSNYSLLKILYGIRNPVVA